MSRSNSSGIRDFCCGTSRATSPAGMRINSFFSSLSTISSALFSTNSPVWITAGLGLSHVNQVLGIDLLGRFEHRFEQLSRRILFADLAQVGTERRALVADLVAVATAYSFGLEEDLASGFNVASESEDLGRIDHGAEPLGSSLLGKKPLEEIADFGTGAARRPGRSLRRESVGVMNSRRPSAHNWAAALGDANRLSMACARCSGDVDSPASCWMLLPTSARARAMAATSAESETGNIWIQSRINRRPRSSMTVDPRRGIRPGPTWAMR